MKEPTSNHSKGLGMTITCEISGEMAKQHQEQGKALNVLHQTRMEGKNLVLVAFDLVGQSTWKFEILNRVDLRRVTAIIDHRSPIQDCSRHSLAYSTY
jgi:hypothetical protein